MSLQRRAAEIVAGLKDSPHRPEGITAQLAELVADLTCHGRQDGTEVEPKSRLRLNLKTTSKGLPSADITVEFDGGVPDAPTREKMLEEALKDLYAALDAMQRATPHEVPIQAAYTEEEIEVLPGEGT